MSNSFLDALRQTAIISNILGGKTGQTGQGVTVPVQDKTGPQPIGPNLAGPRVTMPGPPVTVGPPPSPQEQSQPWFTPDTSSISNFLMKGASGQGNLMDTVNSLVKPYTGTDVQGLGQIVGGIDRGTSAGMESVFPGTGAFLSNPLSAFGFGGGAEEAQQPGMSSEEANLRMRQFMQQQLGQGQVAGGGGGDGLGALRALAGGGSSTVNLGAVPQMPAPPTEAAPAPMDLGGYQQWLEQARPQDTDPKQMEQMLMANFLGGLGSGLSNASGAGSIGDVLLAAGGGALQGVGRGQLDQNRAKERDKEENRRYAGMRAEASLGEAGIRQKDAEAARQVETRNQLRQYEHELRVIEESKPKILGASQDGLVYETNEGGQKKVHTWNSGNSARLALARAAGGRQMMAQTGKALGPLGPLYALAQESRESGMLKEILGDKYDAIMGNARDLAPRYEEGKTNDAAFNTHLDGELVKLFLKSEGARNTALQLFTQPVDGVPADIVEPAKKKGK